MELIDNRHVQGVRVRPLRVERQLAVFAPGYLEETGDPHQYDELTISGDGFALKTEVVLTPPLATETLARRWLVKGLQAPLNKKDKQRARLVVYDGVLIL